LERMHALLVNCNGILDQHQEQQLSVDRQMKLTPDDLQLLRFSCRELLMDLEILRSTNYFVETNHEEHLKKGQRRKRARAVRKICKACGTDHTPQWRRGPDNMLSLCNACGLHFAAIVQREAMVTPTNNNVASIEAVLDVPPQENQRY